MKKQILNLGKTLNQKEQKEIKGGFPFFNCDQFCRFSSGSSYDYLTHQLNRYGLDWSHCAC